MDIVKYDIIKCIWMVETTDQNIIFGKLPKCGEIF